MNKIHIILINYFNWQDTIECLESIKGIDSINFEIVLMEVINKNNSIEELKKHLENYQIRVKFIELSVNKGFAYANNEAIKYILSQNDSEYIWVLNNDTIIKEDSLSSLLKFYKQKAKINKVGFVGSKILEYSNSTIIQTVGGTFNPKTGYSKLIGKNEKDEGQFDNIELKPDYIIGASMFFHKSLIPVIGLMPEDYFLYYEDIDWCITASKNGLTNYTCMNSAILHKQGGSTANKYGKKQINLNTRKYMYSSYLKLYKNHFTDYIYISYLILIKQILGRLIHFQFKEAYIVFKTLFLK